jgi:hypothetical protein
MATSCLATMQKTKRKQLLVDPENLHDLDGTHSVKPINMKPGKNNTTAKG